MLIGDLRHIEAVVVCRRGGRRHWRWALISIFSRRVACGTGESGRAARAQNGASRIRRTDLYADDSPRCSIEAVRRVELRLKGQVNPQLMSQVSPWHGTCEATGQRRATHQCRTAAAACLVCSGAQFINHWTRGQIMQRRGFIKQLALSAALATAGMLAGTPAFAADTIKVGVLHSLSARWQSAKRY